MTGRAWLLIVIIAVTGVGGESPLVRFFRYSEPEETDVRLMRARFDDVVVVDSEATDNFSVSAGGSRDLFIGRIDWQFKGANVLVGSDNYAGRQSAKLISKTRDLIGQQNTAGVSSVVFAISPVTAQISGSLSEVMSRDGDFFFWLHWDGHARIGGGKQNVSTPSSKGVFGLLVIDEPLQNAHYYQSAAKNDREYSSYALKPAIKACLVAGGILCGLAAIAVGLLWAGERNCSVKRQIALCALGCIVTATAPAIALLISHRLIVGDWWPFFGALSSISMLPHSFGSSI
jgi:hypothetical protein